MDAGEWEEEFTEARQRLLESSDFYTLRRRGHHLKNGVVLTSVSDVPFEMSLKCVHCGVAFWFENTAWSTGGIAQWQISSISLEQANMPCQVLAPARLA
jgi:hypothetical protein